MHASRKLRLFVRPKDLTLAYSCFPGDSITLNSNVFTVCSASISPDPPDEDPQPLRPVVLANSLKRPFACVNEAANRDGEGQAQEGQRLPEYGTPRAKGLGRSPRSLVKSPSVAGPAPVSANARAEAASGAGGPFSRKDRIPRPPNAFMLFANEFRKKLSCENPRESNKDISVRWVRPPVGQAVMALQSVGVDTAPFLL